MKKIILLLTIFSLNSWAMPDPALKPFATDYCTLYVEGTHEQPNLWRHCCVEHDLYFWSGGSLDDKKATDLRLKECVKKTGANIQAVLIYTAVVIGGHSPVHIKAKQWGNTWENRPRYLSLTETETSEAIKYLDTHHSDLPSQLKQDFKEQLNSRLDSK